MDDRFDLCEATMTEDVRAFYDRNVETEWGRLELPLQRIELLTTLRLIERYFPPEGRVLDIGAGPGRYALELGRRGYLVSLLELSSGLLERARQVLAAQGIEAESLRTGDARELSAFPSGSYDGALLLGPMYHIVDPAGRARALAELHRILVPGGVAIAAYLNSWGLLRTGITDFPRWFQDPDYVRGMLHQRSYPAGTLSAFTEAHWSTPPDALAEAEVAGFEVLTRAGAEGFCGGMASQVGALAAQDPAAYANVASLAAETAEWPAYRDATDHLLIVLRKPGHPASG